MTSRVNQNGAAGSVKRMYALKVAFNLGLHSNLKNDQILLIYNRTKYPRKKYGTAPSSSTNGIFSSVTLVGSYLNPLKVANKHRKIISLIDERAEVTGKG